MEHNAKNICKTIISDKEHNLNTQMAEFGISKLSILYAPFDQTQYFFKVSKNNLTIQ